MFNSIARTRVVSQTVTKTQVRHAANLSELKARITSIGSIGKLTKAMKMVAASKLRGATVQVENARKFSAGVFAAWDAPESITENPENVSEDLYVVFTSDRGLCGGVNNQVIRVVRPAVRESVKNAGAKLLLVGDKGKGSLEREFAQYFSQTIGDVSKVKKLSFKQVSMTSEAVNDHKYLNGKLVYNKFINSAASVGHTVPFYSADILINNTEITSKYENEGDEELYHNFWEFTNAVRFYEASAENYASETAARMAAMTSSSTNAAEMLNSLTLTYNRTRQAKITSELIEIISGAACAAEMA